MGGGGSEVVRPILVVARKRKRKANRHSIRFRFRQKTAFGPNAGNESYLDQFRVFHSNCKTLYDPVDDLSTMAAKHVLDRHCSGRGSCRSGGWSYSILRAWRVPYITQGACNRPERWTQRSSRIFI